MSLTDQVLAAFVAYGLPVLFVAVLFGSIGVPLPSTFLLIAAGSFVELGEMNLWGVLLLAFGAAILGDQIGYWIGRRGGRGVVLRFTGRFGGERRLLQAEASTRKWGGLSIFISRWLVTPLGSSLNLTSGIAMYSYPRFLFWDVVGELLWVGLYVTIGMLYSDRIEAMTELLGSLIWVLIGLLGVALFAGLLVRKLRTIPAAIEDPTTVSALEPGQDL